MNEQKNISITFIIQSILIEFDKYAPTLHTLGCAFLCRFYFTVAVLYVERTKRKIIKFKVRKQDIKYFLTLNLINKILYNTLK